MRLRRRTIAATGLATIGIVALLIATIERPGAVAGPSVAPSAMTSEAAFATPAATSTATLRPTQIPMPTPIPAPTPLGASVNLPILYIHQVVPIPPGITLWSRDDQLFFLRQSVTVCAFDAQLDWLERRGYHTVLPRDLVAAWAGGPPLPPRPIMLTFDDGSPDWYYTIFPRLLAHGFVGEFYTTLGKVGAEISWAQLLVMVNAGMGIGGHDVDHFQLTGSVPYHSPDEMRYQVTHAKEVLEARLGITVDSMAYVGGGYDAALMEIVRQAGYTSARSINRGAVQELGRLFRLRVSRIGVFDDIMGRTIENAVNCVLNPSLPTFEARVSGAKPG